MRIGIHAPPQGWTEKARNVASALHAEVFLWMPAEGPQDATPGTVNIVRLPTPRVQEMPRDYAMRADVTGILQRWYAAGIPAIFVPGNEPDIRAVDVPVPWNVRDWLSMGPSYASALRRDWTGIVMGAVPFSVENTQYVTDNYLAGFDVITGHCYWQILEDITNPNLGGAWHYLVGKGKPVYITEVNSSGGRTVPHEIVHWLQTLSGIEGVCLFVADGNVENGWPQFDVSPDDAATIWHDFTGTPKPEPPPPPPPPLEPTMNPYAYDGDYAYETFRRMMDGALLTKNPNAASRENYSAAHAAAREQGVSIATMVGWIKSENVDPALVAVNNLGGIKFIGQRRATSGADHDPPVLAPASEGYAPYCVFATPLDFWVTLAVNIATIGPAAWQRGDLRAIARIYTGGAWGEVKVDLVDALRDTGAYPHGTLEDPGDAPPPVQRYRFVYPVDAPILQGSDGSYSHAGSKPGSVFYALDYGCAFGTPIRAIADGTVISNGFNHPLEGQTGHTICVAHADGYESRYCHLSEYDIAVGVAVRQGQIIAHSGAPDILYPGANGFGSGAHLHFSISHDGHWIRCEELMAAGEMGPYDAAAKEQADMPRFGGKLDDGLAEHLWETVNKGKAKKNRIERRDANGNLTGIYSAWRADLSGKGPYGQPWGLPQSKEYSFPDDRTCQDFTNGVATALRQSDGTYTISFN